MFYVNIVGSSITVNALSTFATALWSEIGSTVGGYWSNQVTLTTIDITYIPSVGNELRYTLSGGTTYALAETDVDNVASCYVIDFVISDYYRGGHPRLYMVGPTTNAVSNGSNVSGARQAALVTAWNNLRNWVNAYTAAPITSMSMGTVRYASHNAWLSPPRFTAYTSVKFGKKGKLGSQRRRILT